jgi:hypothetical protein
MDRKFEFEGPSSTRSIYSSTRRDPLKQVALLLSKRNKFSYVARPVTSTTPHVPLLRHVARLVARLIVDYSASRRLVVDYFASAARPGASARRAARHAARRAAHRRLLRPRRASGCLGTSRSSSRGSSSTTSPTPHVRLLRHVARLVA